MSKVLGACVLLGVGAPAALAVPIAQVYNTNQTRDMVWMPANAPMGSWSVGLSSDSLAMSPTGQLFIAAPLGALWEVSGAPTPAGATGRTQIADLDWAPGGLWGYSNASQELFFYDLGSSSVTVSTVLALPAGWTATGVAHEPGSGDLFLSARNGLNNDALWRVPASLSSLVFVGGLSHADAASYVADIDFDASGQLYAMTWFHRHFYTVNPVTAATVLVSIGPHKDATGMALLPVPEPGSAVLMALGLAALLRRRQ